MPKKTVIPLPIVIKALQANAGLIGPSANALGCDRSTLSKRVNRTPQLLSVVEQCREEMTDLAESKLKENINKGDNCAVLFYLKCQGYKRGYWEKSEMHRPNDASDEPTTIRIEMIDGRKNSND
jgi:hypothetical protein